MTRLKYVGSHDAVEVAGLVVKRGASAEFPDDVAKSLAQQKSNWQPVAAETKKEK